MSQYQDYQYIDFSPNPSHSYLLPGIMKLLDPTQNRTILDLGCGNGWIASELLKKGYDVYGVDASPSGIEMAKRVYPDRFFLQNIEDDDLPSALTNKHFDTIISTEVIEHLYSPRQYIDLTKKILAKNGGGTFILSTPYHGYLKNLTIALLGKHDSHYSPLWDGGHIKFWSKKTLSLILCERGYEVKGVVGVGRIPFLWKSMILKAHLS